MAVNLSYRYRTCPGSGFVSLHTEFSDIRSAGYPVNLKGGYPAEFAVWLDTGYPAEYPAIFFPIANYFEIKVPVHLYNFHTLVYFLRNNHYVFSKKISFSSMVS